MTAPIEKRNIPLAGRLVLWGWLLLCVPVSDAGAYDDIPDAPPTSFRQGERQVSPTGAVDAFVLYEYIDPALSGTRKVSPLKHHSKRFVPADMIPVNQPIHMVLRRPIDPANEVANSLYANLKEKRLIEEYVDLQRRAREVLAGLGNPATAPDNRSGTAGAGVPSAAGMVSYRISDTAGAASGRVAGLASGSDAARGSGARNTSASLPWIIEMAFGIFAYLQANKVEAVLFGGLLMTIFIGVSSLRRR